MIIDGQRPRPLVSVVIPTFNCLDYLPKALRSVRDQQVADVEIIVVDDGSDDGTIAWLAEAAHHDPDLRVLGSGRAGPAAARNIAIRHARGTYVAFLDADDTWLPGKLQQQLQFHQAHPDVVFSFTDYRSTRPDGAAAGESFACWDRFRRIAGNGRGFRRLAQPLAVLFAENPVGTSTVVVRRDALGDDLPFDPTLPSAEDVDLWLRLAQRGSVAFTDACLAEYLLRPGSESSKFDKRMLALAMIHRRYRDAALAQDRRSVDRALARLAAARAQQHRAMGRHGDAFRQHARALALAPSRQRLRAVLVDLKKQLRR